MGEPLDDLVDAYRAETSRASGVPGRETRIRLLESAHRSHARRRMLVAASIAGAIVASNATTWALSTGRVGGLLDAMSVEDVTDAALEKAHGTFDLAMKRTSRSVDSVIAELEERDLVEPVLVEPVEGDAVAAEPIEPARDETPAIVHAADRTAERDEPIAVETADEAITEEAERSADPSALSAALRDLEPDVDAAERRAFQRAHDLHFRSQYAPALSSWDSYLSVYPAGRFLPEARFNRAIALLRLGRNDEARAALEPIASGQQGEAHRADAVRLLAAMDDGRLIPH